MHTFQKTLIFLCLAFNTIEGQLEVALPNGPIKGHELKTFTKKSYYAYQGIPYAKPPLGELRFQAPVAPDNWSNVLEVTADTKFCYEITSDSSSETEDCLFINVFTPVLNAKSNNTKLPVIFWIYGGGFRAGHTLFGGNRPENFMDEDVILVTHNYRVGVFGFLSTGDTIIPGNAGLKDQQFALKWTNENIHLFGGDPNKITIFGQSAGGASVGYQLLSKQSSGLFRAAIADSGSPLNEWTYLDTPKEYAIQLAQALDSSFSSNASSEYLKAFLTAAEAKAIDTASTKTKISQPDITIEPQHDGAFLTAKMYESFASGDFNRVPVLMGINSEERITIISDLSSVQHEADVFDAYPEKLVPSFLKSETDKKTIGQAIKQIYVGTDNFANHLGRCVRYDSDNRFTRGIIKQAKLMAPFTTVYFYQFSYDGIMGGFNLTIDDAERVGHAEDVHYIFAGSPLNNLEEGDALTVQRLVKMWTRFVKYLNPTPTGDSILHIPKWPQVTEGSYSYMNINNTLSVETNPKGDFYLGWEKVFENYSPRPYVTF